MNANDVIDLYVKDVAARLPRNKRNDVAFELRALLLESLHDRSAAGQNADADIAMTLVREFGRPDEVAARYLPVLSIIDPADGARFLRLTWIGLAIIWSLGLLSVVRQAADSGADALQIIAQWWATAVLPSFWWPGVLVAWYGLSARSRRRHSQVPEWTPSAARKPEGGRGALLLGVFGIVTGICVLIEPRWILDLFWGGKAAPAAYTALTYTDTFLQRQAPVLLTLLVLNIPLYISVIVRGRWSATLRRCEELLGLATCAAMAWTVLDGPVFLAASSDQMAKSLMVLIIVFILIGYAVRLYRHVKPAPDASGLMTKL